MYGARISDGLLSAIIGTVFGAVMYFAASIVLISAVPRRSEGVREVADISWPVFASFPATVSVIALLAVLFIPLPRRLSRIVILLAAGLAVMLSAMLTLDLIRRDFEGKF
jgi:hypothetical protein